MRKFLIIQLRPENEAADNEFEAFLKYGGLKLEEVERLHLDRTPLPEFSLDDYAAIIVGGSPFDVSKPQTDKDDIQLRVERDFKKLFDQVVTRDFPFLGACSGSGLLGGYLGAEISKKYSEPVGGVDVAVTEAGAQDPLLQGLPKKFRALVGHKEACDQTPPGAILLAGSAACPVQMFRVKNNVYATQFHPEGDPEGFELRIKIYKDHGYFPPEQADALIANVKHEKTPVPQEMLKRFVGRYRK